MKIMKYCPECALPSEFNSVHRCHLNSNEDDVKIQNQFNVNLEMDNCFNTTNYNINNYDINYRVEDHHIKLHQDTVLNASKYIDVDSSKTSNASRLLFTMLVCGILGYVGFWAIMMLIAL